MKKLFISCAYIYPLCPLNINHTRMFLVGDILARKAKQEGKEVLFPIASHYSGNTAQSTAKIFKDIFSNKKTLDKKQEKTLNLYKNIYKTPISTLKTFTKSLNLLDYYNLETLKELKDLNILCDYKNFYTTKDEDFSTFVNVIISEYKKNGLLVENKRGELSLDYDNETWKNKTIELINRIEFLQPFHKNNTLSAMKDVRNDWPLLRKNGFGVKYQKEWIVDPMFDSELFTIFDIYTRFKDEEKIDNTHEFFTELFETIKTGKKKNKKLINKIVDWLPCDTFICEEHLKNWIVKKLYTESILLNKKYQTKKFFVLGMGFLNGRQMSASKGHAILSKDLIEEHGGITARLVILLTGGHPSKMYNYDQNLPKEAKILLKKFAKHYKYLTLNYQNTDEENINPDCKITKKIEKNLENGYYRQAIIELLSTLNRKYKPLDEQKASHLINTYKRYCNILLPGLLENIDDFL